jgi:tetraacyldisaccharide 4'-kinase
MISAWRSWLYRGGVFKSVKLPSPVISVGNLTMGGTGKSPFCLFLADWFLKKNISVALLSRGYGRKKKTLEIVAPGEALPSENQIGDEPWMIKNRLPRLTLLVHPDRVRMAKRHWDDLGAPKLVILDDGFQHWKAVRNWDVVMIDATESLRGKEIPFGRMREYPKALKRADVIVITRADGVEPQELLCLENELYRVSRSRICPPWKTQTLPNPKIVKARYVFDGIFSFEKPENAESFSEKKWILISGVAKPDSVRFVLKNAGVHLVEEVYFPDHHRLESRDLQLIRRCLKSHPKAKLLTTEKDCARWRKDLADFSAYGFRIKMDFLNAGEKILEEFLEEVRKCSI